MLKNAALLGLFSMVTALILALTFFATKDRIATIQREVEARSLKEVIGTSLYDNDLLTSTIPLEKAGSRALNLAPGSPIYYASLEGRIQAFILATVAPDGYSGNIRMLIGIDRQQRITGLRVTKHSETPGLGDKVDLTKSNWVLSFDKKGFDNLPRSQWKVKKDGGNFDAFTGATITPRAVVNQVRHTLDFFIANNEKMLSAARLAKEPAIND